MSSGPKKSLPPTPRADKTSTTPQSQASSPGTRGPSRSPIPNTNSTNGISRRPSARGAGAPQFSSGTSRRPAATSSLSFTGTDIDDEEANAAGRHDLVDEYKEKLSEVESELASKKQELAIAQERLESLAKVHDELAESEAKNEDLETKNKDMQLRIRKMDDAYENDNRRWMDEKEHMKASEETLQETIVRLNSRLRTRQRLEPREDLGGDEERSCMWKISSQRLFDS
jgi:hypothetical protein